MEQDKSRILLICFAVAAAFVAIIFYILSFSNNTSPSSVIANYNDDISTESRAPVQYADSTKTDTMTTNLNDNTHYSSQISNSTDSSAQSGPSAVEIFGVNIENTFAGTNKSARCVVDLDKENDVLTLRPVEKESQFFRIQKPDEKQSTFQFINDGIIEAEKTIYRRTDLEIDDKALIYTSRTGEVKITLIKEDL